MRSSTPSTSARQDWHRRPWAEWLVVGVTVASLSVFGLGTAFTRAGDTPRDVQLPATVGGLVARGAAWFDANFLWRQRLVAADAWWRVHGLGVSALGTVWRGRDGWWFYADDGAVEDAINASPLSTAELEEWRVTLQHTRDWLAARGIAYVFVVAPDKHAVYPEYLPEGLHRRLGPTRTDELVAHLRARSTVPVVDLLDTLATARANQRIYHRTDSHWNDVGAATAYRAILTALSAQTSALGPPAPAEAFDLVTRVEPGWDLAEMLGLSSSLRETNLALVPRRPRRASIVEPSPAPAHYASPRLVTALDDRSLPRVVFYRDSFGSALVPFLAEHAQRMTVLWEYDVVPATIREERPAVVIQQWAGRRLHTRLPFDAVVQDQEAAADLRRSVTARR